MDEETILQAIELIKIHRRGLQVLEQQAAVFGLLCPPAHLLQIEEAKKRIQLLKVQIKDLVLQGAEQHTASDQTITQSGSASEVLQDRQLVEHMRFLIEMIQSSTKLQAYIDVFEEMIIHARESGYEAEIAKTLIPLMQNKISANNFARYHYVLANWHFIIEEYDNCVKHINEAINISNDEQHVLLRARSLYALAEKAYSSANTKLTDTINIEESIQITGEMAIAQNDIHKSKNDIMFLRRKDPVNKLYISLEQEIKDLLLKVDISKTLAENREMQLRIEERVQEDQRNERIVQEEHKREEY